MYFNSFQYVLFLWTVFVLYWTWREGRRLRFSMVLIASYWFYAQADWRFTSLLFISTVTDFVAGKRIEEAGEEQGKRRFWMGVSLVVNLGMLGFFKYYDFFVDSIEEVLAGIGRETNLWHLSEEKGGWLDYVVPAGISFYTFQTLSYTLDIYKRRMKPCQSWLDFAVYVSFFPQLVAGPIVRAIDFLPQMEKPAAFERSRISSGLFQILRGMTKKLLMADILGVYLIDWAFRNDPDAGLTTADTIATLGAPRLIVVLYAYVLQLYGDFAGYSDIAIGSARLLGFDLPKNFDAPFKSKSIEEFWGRWHISMSSWFTDYVYIGLGGSRSGLARTLANTTVAWTLVGLWHGASWVFVIWGFYHAMCLCVSRLVRLAIPGGKLPDKPVFSVLGVLMVLHVHVVGMALFRCPDLASFRALCAELLDWSGGLDPGIPAVLWVVIALGYASHYLPERWIERTQRAFAATPAPVQGLILVAAILVFFVLAPAQAPFIYFQF